MLRMSFAKKGEASAGVHRQWNGRLGKVDNCQVGVFANLCRGDMATLIDARLYLPEYCLSNAPLDTPCQELARVQAQRFFIEHSFREAKSECGMADYQVRRYDAWHNHMALVMLGTLFLIKQKTAGRQQWPMLSFNDLVTALEHLLPRRQFTAEDLADIINKRHYLRQKAKKSHARRPQVALE